MPGMVGSPGACHWPDSLSVTRLVASALRVRTSFEHRHTVMGLAAPWEESDPPQREQNCGPEESVRFQGCFRPREFMVDALLVSRWRQPVATRSARSHSSKGRLDSDVLAQYSTGRDMEFVARFWHRVTRGIIDYRHVGGEKVEVSRADTVLSSGVRFSLARNLLYRNGEAEIQIEGYP